MYSIGHFSKINRITTKTLRHYDKIGLLKPEYVDHRSKYRYYTTNQLLKIHQIINLKQMGLSLDDIKEIIDDDRKIVEFIKSKEEEIKNNIKEEKQRLLQIKNFNNILKGDFKGMYNPIIKELPEVKIASMRTILKSYNDLFNLCPNVMGKEMERLGCKCAVPDYCFNIYHDGEYKERDIDVEICQAVMELKEDSDILKFKTIPKVPKALCILHKGPYSNLGETYSFAFTWIKDNNYKVVGNLRESYIDGIWNKEDESEWLTEIQIPIESA